MCQTRFAERSSGNSSAPYPTARRWRRAASLMVTFAVFAVACGDDDAETTPAETDASGDATAPPSAAPTETTGADSPTTEPPPTSAVERRVG